MEQENSGDLKPATAEQKNLIRKILQSSRLKDSEYRMLKKLVDSKVVSSYDASVLIDYVLKVLRFRRHFFNGKHRAYKKCEFCGSRDEVSRYADASDMNNKLWSCETCALNIPDKLVKVKFAEENEAKADLYAKYDYPAEQESIDRNE